MKKIEKYFEGKISYKAIDDFVDKTRAALDPDDDFYIEWHIQEDYQFISVNVVDRVISEMKNLPINIDGRVINCPSNDNFQHFYSQLQRWTGVKKSFHTTRHTFASRCAMNGWSIAEISAQGGWKNLSILKRYTHIKAEHLASKLSY